MMKSSPVNIIWKVMYLDEMLLDLSLDAHNTNKDEVIKASSCKLETFGRIEEQSCFVLCRI